MEGDPDGAREVHLSTLREDHPAAGAVPYPLRGVIARDGAGPSLLAMILYAKFGEHQPLNRQSASYVREGIELDTSTLADWVGACTASLAPLIELIRHHVLAGERVHGDDTTVPVLAKQRTVIGRVWTYVRDDRPFAGPDPPAALFFYSRNRNGEHPNRHLAGYAGILQADAYAGFGDLYDARRRPGPITEAACWSHSRRKFFELADLRKAPLAVEAVRRIDAIFAIEREINGATGEQRLAVRQERVKPLVGELERWMLAERARLSRHADLAKAIDYMLKRWPAFTRFLDDGRICLSNNAAERALRGIALGRRAWLFAGSDRGGERAAAMYTLIATAKLNGVDPPASAFRRIASHRRPSGLPAARAAALALEAPRNSSRCRLTTSPSRPSPDAYAPTGDFEEALASLVGKDAPGLSASTIARLKSLPSRKRGKCGPRSMRAGRSAICQPSATSIAGPMASIWRPGSRNRRSVSWSSSARRLKARRNSSASPMACARAPNRGVICCSI